MFKPTLAISKIASKNSSSHKQSRSQHLEYSVHSNRLSMTEDLKAQGNALFKAGDFTNALQIYSSAIDALKGDHNETYVTLLCNRAACNIKILDWTSCINDCNSALNVNPMSTKALYRRATAYENTKENTKAVSDLNTLLRYDPKNSEAIIAIRRLKALLQQEMADSTQIKLILDSIRKDSSNTLSGLKSLIGLTYDDKNHAMDLARKGGLVWLLQMINSHLSADGGSEDEVLVAALRVLSACSTHKTFVDCHINFTEVSLELNSGSMGLEMSDSSSRITLSSICTLLSTPNSTVLQIAIMTLMSVLKHLPASPELAKKSGSNSSNKTKSEGSEAEAVQVDADIHFTLSKPMVKVILTGFRNALRSKSDVYSVVTDSLSAFLSESADYFEANKEVDIRMETLPERKLRLREQRILHTRSSNHAHWAVECGILALLVDHIDCESPSIRQNAATCLGKLVNFYGDEEAVKSRLEPFLQGHDDLQEEFSESKRVVELSDSAPPSVAQCRRRAALEAILLMSKPELGCWALALPGGVPQLLFLVATQDPRCQEIAAEVMCLAASSEGSASQLSTIVSSGTLTTLMHSPYSGTRAAAASTITKLSLKAKALNEDSAEVAQVLNTVLGVLKSANQPLSDEKVVQQAESKVKSESKLVSFSSLDEVSSSQQAEAKRQVAEKKAQQGAKKSSAAVSSSVEQQANNAVIMTSVERAIEVLAAMIGKTYVKEEIVHGSYRVAACIAELTKLDLDVRSTAAYGLTHILAALTVTNNELHAKALADKDISPEQYQQMQDLQRIKTKDEEGNVIEEKREESDPDTQELCKRRIQRLVACNVISCLVKYLNSGSNQTKEAAARTLRQICVEESSRGLMLQQGGFKACCSASIDEDLQKSTRLECAHAVAKTLVTSNPNLLTEHMRLGAIKPLVYLCKETDATNLQQFEALLALTNILSCGSAEHDRFSSERGISAVHFLIFSDNTMVRRAATETLCNMSSHEGLLKIMRQPDKVRLWLGLAEDWDNADNEHESFLIARAAAGTLAGAVSDPEVASAVTVEKIAGTLVILLNSQNPELVHRALVIILELMSTEKREVAEHLVLGEVIPAISVVTKMTDHPHLAELAMNCAQAMSAVMKSTPATNELVVG